MWRRSNERVIDRQRRSRTFDAGRGMTALIGIAAVALGTGALVTTGLDTSDWTRPHEEFLGLRHSPALAAGEIGFGLLMLFAAMTTYLGRLVSALLGAALLAFGILVIADVRRARLQDTLAVQDANGWVFAVTGALGLVAVVMMPIVRTTRVTSVHEREVPAPADDTGHEHFWNRRRHPVAS